LSEPEKSGKKNNKKTNFAMGMDLRGFHHRKRLTTMVRRDGDLGGRQGRLPAVTAKLFPLWIKNPIADFGYILILEFFMTSI
jgi:hypothetical protein